MGHPIRLILFSLVAFFLLGSNPPAFAQAAIQDVTVEMIFDSLNQLEAKLKGMGKPVRCRQAVQHSLWARVFPKVRKKEQAEAEAEWARDIEFSADVLRRFKENSLGILGRVFYRLSQNKAGFGEVTSVDPAIQAIVFPLVEAQIGRLIAEATDTDPIYVINDFLIQDLEIQLQRAMRYLLREKMIRVTKLWQLQREIESNVSGAPMISLDSFVDQIHLRIFDTAIDIHTIDALVESGMKDLWELCPDCK